MVGRVEEIARVGKCVQMDVAIINNAPNLGSGHWLSIIQSGLIVFRRL